MHHDRITYWASKMPAMFAVANVGVYIYLSACRGSVIRAVMPLSGLYWPLSLTWMGFQLVVLCAGVGSWIAVTSARRARVRTTGLFVGCLVWGSIGALVGAKYFNETYYSPPTPLIAGGYYMASIITVVLASAIVRHNRRKYGAPDSCRSCGYDLSGLALGANCPECGAASATPPA